jgi:hypothetical protein
MNVRKPTLVENPPPINELLVTLARRGALQ